MSGQSGQKNIVILGASYGGLSAAHYFLKHVLPRLPSNEKYHVYLVNPSTHFYHRVASPRSVASFELMPVAKTFLEIKPGFKQYKSDVFTFVQGKAVTTDTAGRTVTIKHTGAADGTVETLSYHALILATGTKTFDPTLSLQGGLHEDILKALAYMHKKLKTAKTIVVAGGGPAGVEVAGEVGEYLNGAAGWFQKRPANPKAKITLYSGSKKLLPILRPALAQQAEVYLARVGVDVVHNIKMDRVVESASGKTKVIFSNGDEVECDVFIPCMGVTPMTEYLPKQLLTETGYINTNKETLRVDAAGPRVYAVGDAASYTRGGIMDMFEAIPVVMTNLQRDLLAASKDPNAKPSGPDRKFTPITAETQLVPVGQSKGVGAFNGNKLPNLMVYMIKGKDYMSSSATDILSGNKWKKENGWKPTDG
ncbi:hypothetical protein AAFC00_003672 [Neodothiora populina]|uniref:FAD/NAD(P)-binding domain-containing protein n=1 Tax=Neodothiora populina TaxID=2781224 RepID=A0ABR3PF03_9PEZI